MRAFPHLDKMFYLGIIWQQYTVSTDIKSVEYQKNLLKITRTNKHEISKSNIHEVFIIIKSVLLHTSNEHLETIIKI